MLELLDALAKQGSELVIISARKNATLLKQELSYLGLLKHFSRIFVVKPQTGATEKGAILQKLCPDLYVGDTEMDAQGKTGPERQ